MYSRECGNVLIQISSTRFVDTKQRILRIFARYKQFGGEETVAIKIQEDLRPWLDADWFEGSTDELLGNRLIDRLAAALKVIHHKAAAHRFRELPRKARYDALEIHNVRRQFMLRLLIRACKLFISCSGGVCPTFRAPRVMDECQIRCCSIDLGRTIRFNGSGGLGERKTSGPCGAYRTAKFLRLSPIQITAGWLARPMAFALVFAVVSLISSSPFLNSHVFWIFAVAAAITGAMGLVIFYLIGLQRPLEMELNQLLASLIRRSAPHRVGRAGRPL